MTLKLRNPRKIVSWDYSFLVTLPHSWLRHHEIGKGDYIDFEIDNEQRLILKPKKNEETPN